MPKRPLLRWAGRQRVGHRILGRADVAGGDCFDHEDATRFGFISGRQGGTGVARCDVDVRGDDEVAGNAGSTGCNIDDAYYGVFFVWDRVDDGSRPGCTRGDVDSAVYDSGVGEEVARAIEDADVVFILKDGAGTFDYSDAFFIDDGNDYVAGT